MKSFALGRYVPLDSLIHRMDPRAKIMAMILLLIGIFIPAGFIGYAVIGVLICAGVIIAKLSLDFIWRSMKPMLFMLVFLLIINLLVIKTGTLLATIWVFTIYSGAIMQTLYIVVRLMLMIVITTLLTATTKPLEMTLGIEDLLKPFVRFKVPAHEIAMMISIALRFIPTLIEETERIMRAQQSRGVDLQEGKIKEKIMAVLSLIVPLFISAFQRAEDLANAMEARGYNPGWKRNRYKKLRMQSRDWGLLMVCCLLDVALIGIAVL